MRHFLTGLLVLISLGWMTPRSHAQDAAAKSTIVVGLPGSCTPESSAATKELFGQLIQSLPAGTRLVTFDATNRQRLADVEVPDMPANGRVRILNRPLAPVWDHLKKAQAVREGGGADELNVPGFVSTLASFMSTTGGPVRLILVGSPYHKDGDRGATFARGEVPSVDHILAGTRESPFGTSDIGRALDQIKVDWLLVGDQSTTRERAHVSAFWATYFGRTGAKLCTFLESATDVADRASKNTSDAAPADAPKATGKLQILKIDALEKAPVAQADPTPAPRKVFEVPADVEQVIVTPVSAVLVFDGSASNGEALRQGGKLATDIARIGADLAPAFSLGVIVHRGKDLLNTFGPTTIERATDAQASRGLAALSSFITTPTIPIHRLASVNGETAGPRTGETATITPFEPTTGFVDVEQALVKAIELVRASTHPRRVLLVVGDASPSEFDRAFGVSDDDRQSEARVMAAVDAFLKACPNARIVTVYTGPRSGEANFRPDHDEAVRFLRALAAKAGDRGIYNDSLRGMDDSVKRAVLNP